jgi:hypothetical protein
MAEAVARELRQLPALFRALNLEQRVASVAALLLLVSTFGPFSFVEAAEVLIALGVLALLRARALGKRFHLPLGDGTAIAAAGLWAGLLIVVRLFDRPLGQNLLALACCAILVLTGVRERAKRPADDLPAEPVRTPGERFRGDLLEDVERHPGAATPAGRRRAPVPEAEEGDEATEPLPPPEFQPAAEETPPEEPGAEAGEQLALPDADDEVKPPAESPDESEIETRGRNGA